jgi:hypothetical protein
VVGTSKLRSGHDPEFKRREFGSCPQARIGDMTRTPYGCLGIVWIKVGSGSCPYRPHKSPLLQYSPSIPNKIAGFRVLHRADMPG